MKPRAPWLGPACRTLVLSWILMAAACSGTPPEAALRQTIADARDAAEKRDAASLKDTLAGDFVGPQGMDRQGLARMAQAVFLRHQGIDATLGPLDIDMHGDAATERFTAAVTGGNGLLPDTGQVYDVDTDWRLEDGEWRLVRANWKPQL